MWDGSAWQTENVDTLDDVRMGMTGARKITALVLDDDGTPHLAYTDRSRVAYAVRGDSGWATQDAALAGDAPLGQLVELALDADGNPHLIWFQVTALSPLSGIVMYSFGS